MNFVVRVRRLEFQKASKPQFLRDEKTNSKKYLFWFNSILGAVHYLLFGKIVSYLLFIISHFYQHRKVGQLCIQNMRESEARHWPSSPNWMALARVKLESGRLYVRINRGPRLSQDSPTELVKNRLSRILRNRLNCVYFRTFRANRFLRNAFLFSILFSLIILFQLTYSLLAW